MLNNRTFLAIIPARGGSKRLPRKNMLDLNGKPLIVWSIDAAKKSQYIDDIIVTSDDKEILELSKSHHIKTIKRPDELANDTATTFDAIKHTVENTDHYDFIILLQPTSPLRSEKHIDKAIEQLFLKSADAVVSISETEHSPLWCNTLPIDGNMQNFITSDIKNTRSQDLEIYYRLNGAIYICKTEKLLQQKSFMIDEKIYAYLMDKNFSVDIDDEADFALVKILSRNK